MESVVFFRPDNIAAITRPIENICTPERGVAVEGAAHKYQF